MLTNTTVFSRLEGKNLPYNAFAFKIDRNVGQGLMDKCILYRARASVVNLAECAPGTPWGPTPTPVVVQELLRKRKWEEDNGEATPVTDGDPSATASAKSDDAPSLARSVANGGRSVDGGLRGEREGREEADEDDDDGQDEDFTLSRSVYVGCPGVCCMRLSSNCRPSWYRTVDPTAKARERTPPRLCCLGARRFLRCASSWWATASCGAWSASSQYANDHRSDSPPRCTL